MKKIVKASIATAAGAVLLLGGAGTFATWNSSATAGTGTAITAGDLKVDGLPAETGVWKNAANQVVDIAGYRIVPGDVLTYTKKMKVGAEGDTLSATLGLSEESISPLDPTNNADVKLDSYLEANAVLDISGTGIAAGTAANTFSVTPAGAVVAQDATVTVTITFPDGTLGADNDAMNGKVTLNDLTVTLTQNVED